MCRCESGWSPQFRWAEVRRLSLQTEGVVAHRERAAGRESGVAGSSPACEAPYLRQHLSIEFFRRAVELGLSAKRETASGFKSRPSHQNGWVPSSSLVRLASSTGRRIGLSLVTRVVAGSSPASGPKCRSSSVVEHVYLSVRSLSAGTFQRAVDCGFSWTR